LRTSIPYPEILSRNAVQECGKPQLLEKAQKIAGPEAFVTPQTRLEEEERVYGIVAKPRSLSK
jgi:hypothetical protein